MLYTSTMVWYFFPYICVQFCLMLFFSTFDIEYLLDLIWYLLISLNIEFQATHFFNIIAWIDIARCNNSTNVKLIQHMSSLSTQFNVSKLKTSFKHTFRWQDGMASFLCSFTIGRYNYTYFYTYPQ